MGPIEHYTWLFVFYCDEFEIFASIVLLFWKKNEKGFGGIRNIMMLCLHLMSVSSACIICFQVRGRPLFLGIKIDHSFIFEQFYCF